jgi:hypothetical protein
MNCPTCGHAVKVEGHITMHYEPTGCIPVSTVMGWLDELWKQIEKPDTAEWFKRGYNCSIADIKQKVKEYLR